MTTWNLAHLFESVADAVPDREALVVGDRRLTYAGLDQRANRLANHLAGEGIGEGDHIGLQLLNGTEYLEGMLACFKLGAVPINVNYRYVEGELRHLFTDADLVGLVHHRQFADRIEAVRGDVPGLRLLLEVDDDGDGPGLDGSQPYEAALDAASPERPDPTGRSGDDHYIVYTGGTTGMPKGVVWRHVDIFFAAMGGGDVLRMDNFITSPDGLPARLQDNSIVALPTPPLMHASAHWLTFHQFFTGGKVVFPPFGRFDAATIWELIGAEQVFMLVIVGDAMAKPLIDELAANPDTYATDTLWVVGSGGAILSQTNRDRILELLPNRMIADGLGSSETGTIGSKRGQGGATFLLNDETAVLDDQHEPVGPGQTGMLARRGHIPLGYWGDEEKTARTFVEHGGHRWVLPGDLARVEDDGSVTLLGRGSTSINTGGEKVFPEEVEAAIKAHPGVQDVLVVGVTDARWGQTVVAVVQPSTAGAPDLDALRDHCRTHVAGYKIPRALVLVDELRRSAAGKADYKWAKQAALDAMD